jgi:uncharacterized damage-inducible protein DinB
MVTSDYARKMAAYNRWMNEKLYAACARLDADALRADRGAFFGSVLGTLNHLMVADLIWLRRFSALPSGAPALAPLAQLPVPTALDELLFPEFDALREARVRLDAAIEAWAGALGPGDPDQVLEYTKQGQRVRVRLAGVAMHFFNHQTHHRGQITTLLSQAGIDVGVTDLRALLADEP